MKLLIGKHVSGNKWSHRGTDGGYDESLIYIVPKEPEGYRYITESDEFDKRALWWDESSLTWEKTSNIYSKYNKTLVYIVPIEKSEDASVKSESFSDLISRHARELLEIIESDNLNDCQKFALKFIHSTLESAQKLF